MLQEPTIPSVSKASRLIVFLAFAAMLFGSLGLFTWQVFVPAIVNRVPPATWSWSTIILFEVGLLMCLAWLGFGIYRRFATQLSSSGVSVPTLRGRAFVPWSQVERVKVEGHEIKLYGSGQSIVVNVFCYTQPEQIGRFVSRRLPASVLEQHAA